MSDDLETASFTSAKLIGLVFGPAFFAATFFVAPPDGLTLEAWRVGGLALWMGVWWATEAAPIAATSLLPLVLIGLIGAGTERQAAAPYANPIVLLLMGGSILAVAIERWGLHKRFALTALSLADGKPGALVFGFMLVTAFISMWISNTATALMMMPIALSVATAAGPDQKRFAQALILGVAYASSVGGVATPIGTPTNLIAMGWMREELGQNVSFIDWLSVGLPTMLLLLPAAWLVVTFGMKAGGARIGVAGAEIAAERAALGPIREPEVRVLAVFALVISLWVSGEFLRKTLGLPGLTDMAIVVAGAVAMMLVPAGKAAPGRALLTWPEAVKIPWGVMLLFGGGLSLAEAMERTRLAEWLGQGLSGLAGAEPILIVLAVTALVIVLTEFMSNVATITMLLPVLGALAKATGIDPVVLVVPAAIAASCGFMMPAGTGPNAVAYSTGRTSVAGMMGRGLWVNIAALAIMTAIGVWVAPRVLG